MSAADRSCGFCRKGRAEVCFMVAGLDASICDLCLQLAMDVHFEAVRGLPAPRVPVAPAAPDLDTQIAGLPGLSGRAEDCLWWRWHPPSGALWPTLHDLTQATQGELLRVRGLGPRTLAEIEAWLAGMGLSLAGEGR